MKSLNLMLRVSSLAVGALCAAVGVADEVAYVGQDLGTISVSGTGKSTMVSVTFKELGTAGTDVSAANIVSTRNLAAGDQLFIYSNGGYVAWKLVEAGTAPSTYLTWQKVDKKFSVGANGALSNSEGQDATDVTVPVGSGFWLVRNNSTTENPFYIFGAYVAPSTSTAAHGATSLMGNPCMEAKSPVLTNVAEGDSIQLMGAKGLNVFNYTTINGEAKWRGVGKDANGKLVPYAETTPPSIPAGAGFWYVSKGSTDVTFNWSQN